MDEKDDIEEYTIYFRINEEPCFVRCGLKKVEFLQLKYDDVYTWEFIESLYNPAGTDQTVSKKNIRFLRRSLDRIDFREVKKPYRSPPKSHSLLSAVDSDSGADSIPSGSTLNPQSPVSLSDASSSRGDSLVRPHEKQKHNTDATITPSTSNNIAESAKLKKRNTKSSSWAYYTNKNPQSAICTFCNVSVTHSGGATNLQRHLDVHQSSLGLLSSSKNKRRNLTSESSGASDGDSEPISKRKKVLSKTSLPRIDECFNKVRSFAPGGVKADEITNALVYMIAKDKEPFNIVNREGFTHLLKVVAPHYQAPSRTTLTKLIDTRYVQCKTCYTATLKKAASYTLTCDNWTDCTTQTYLGVTIHYLSEDLLMKSGCLGVFPLEKDHTADYLADCLNSIINDFGLDTNKIMALTSDGAANIQAATQNVVGKDRQIWCLAHLITFCTQSISRQKDPCLVIVQNIDTVRQFVKMVRRSTVVSDELKRLQIADGKTEGTALKFMLDCPTKWNSEFFMLERFLLLEEYLSGIIRKCKTKFPDMLNGSQLEILSEAVQLMKPIEFVIREISGSDYPMCSIIIPIVACLKESLEGMKPATAEAIHFKSKLMARLKDKFSGVEDNKILAIPTILDPRFKKINFVNPISVKNAVKPVDRELRSIGVKAIGEERVIQDKVKESTEFSLWRTHDAKVAKAVTAVTEDEYLAKELSEYLKAPVIPRHKNPLEEWKALRPAYPALYELAIRYVSIVGTSVPPERLFSIAGKIKSAAGSRLTGEHLNRVEFLGSLPKEEWKLE